MNSYIALLLVRLPALLSKLRAQPVVPLPRFLERCAWAAPRLQRASQFAAAKVCYEKYIEGAAVGHQRKLDRMADVKGAADDTIASPSGAAKARAAAAAAALAAAAAAPLRGDELVAHVQALYGLAECNFRLLLARDSLLSLPGSLSQADSILTDLHAAITLLLDAEDESLAWLVFNGCTMLWDILTPIAGLGHVASDAASFSLPAHLQWVLLALESQTTLCGVRFLPFRVQVYLAIARAYESQGGDDADRVRAVLVRGLDKVREVASWEAVAQPVPARNAFILRQAAQALSAGLLKCAWTTGGLSETELDARLASDFTPATEGPAHLSVLLQLLSDPSRRTLDTFVADVSAAVDAFAEREKAEAARRKREEEATLASTADLAAGMAPAAAAVGAGASAANAAGGKGAASASRRRKSITGPLSVETILAEYARATAAASAGAAGTTDADRPATGVKAAPTTAAGRKARPASSANTLEVDVDADAQSSVPLPPRDVRDPRAVLLVQRSVRALKEMLAATTPLGVLEAMALRVGGGAASLSDLIDPHSSSSSKGSKSKSVAIAPTPAPVRHDLPGDWVPLSAIASVARAAFAAGCWEEFHAAAAEFDARVNEGSQWYSSARQEELAADRGQGGTGMEVELQLLRRLNSVRESLRAGSVGSRAIDVQAIQEFSSWLLEQAAPAGTKDSSALLSPSSSASPHSPTAFPSDSVPSPSSPPPAAADGLLFRHPDLLLDSLSFVWKFFLQPMLRVEPAAGDEGMPRQVYPPATMEAEAAKPQGATAVPPFSPMHTGALITGLRATVTCLCELHTSDLLWLSTAVLELVSLLQTSAPRSSGDASPAVRRSKRPGADALNSVISVLQPAMARVESHLGQVLRVAGAAYAGGTLHSIVARFDAHVRKLKQAAEGSEEQVEDEEHSAPDGAERSRPIAPALSRADATLSCVYADMLLALYDAQLRLGLLHARASARSAHAKQVAALESKYALSASYRRPPPPLELPPFSVGTEKSLDASCGSNPFRRAILLLAMLPYRPTLAAQEEFLRSRVQPALDDLARVEADMLRDAQLQQWDNGNNVGGGAFVFHTRFGSKASTERRKGPPDAHSMSTSTEASRAAYAARKEMSKQRAGAQSQWDRLPPPRLVSRSCTSLVVQPVVPRDFQRASGARGVILYGKASDTGIDVSAGPACADYYPLGVEVALPPLDAAQGHSAEIPAIELTHLPPNTRFVFACIAVGASGEAIGPIGETTPRGGFVTAIPVPQAMLQGYLTRTLRSIGDQARLQKEATERGEGGSAKEQAAGEEEKQMGSSPDALVIVAHTPLSSSSSSFASSGTFSFSRQLLKASWSLLAPFVRIRAQVSHIKPSKAGGAARALGRGDRLHYAALGQEMKLDEEDEEEEKEEQKQHLVAGHITSFANRHATNGVADSYTLGPAPSAAYPFRLDHWQLSAPLLQAAPRPLLHQLALAAMVHADCIALQPLANANVGVGGTKPPAAMQLRSLEVLRSLLLALQITLAIEDWRAASATLLKSFDAMAPLLDAFTAGSNGYSLGASSTLVLYPLSALFSAHLLLRARLPYDLVTPALQRAGSRITFTLLRALEVRHEHSLLGHVLSQYAALCSATHAAVSDAYHAALKSYRARQGQIELARLRAAQLREALVTEAAAETARLEKESAKDASKRGGGSKKASAAAAGAGAGAGAVSARKKRTSAAGGGGDSSNEMDDASSRPTTARDEPAPPPSADDIAAQAAAANPAVAAILHHPLLQAYAGHRPRRGDYFRVMQEDRALVAYMLASRSPVVAEWGGKLAASMLGRLGSDDDDHDVASSLPDASAPPAPAEESGKKRGKAAVEEEVAPARPSVDIEASMSEALARIHASTPSPSLSLGVSSSSTQLWLGAFTSLSSEWSSHSRFLELASRFARCALERGDVAAAKAILASPGVEDVVDLVADPRLRSEEQHASAPSITPTTTADALDVPATHDAQLASPAALSDDAPSGSAASGVSPATREKGATGRPTASRQGTRKPDQLSAEEPPQAAVPKSLPAFTREQLMWLAELELLRAQVVAIELDALRARMLESGASQPSPSPLNALGWEWDLDRASKLRPSTMGLQLPTRRVVARSDATPVLPSEGDVSAQAAGKNLKFPPLSGAGASPRLGSKAAAASGKSPRLGARKTSAAEAAAADVAAEGGVTNDDKQDPAVMELALFRRLGRAVWLASRARAWVLLQSMVGHVLNALQGGRIKYTPGELAVRVHTLQPIIDEQAASASVSSSLSSEPAPASPPAPSDASGAHFQHPLAVIVLVGRKVLEMLEHMQQGQPQERSHTQQQVNHMHLQLSRDVPAVAEFMAGSGSSDPVATSRSSSDPFWFLSLSSLSLPPILRFLRYATSASFHALNWGDVLQLSAGVHSTLGPAFWLGVGKYAIYACEETRHKAHSALDAKRSDTAALRRAFENDARIIRERQESRRSQRGKREEEERLELLQRMFEERRAPLEAELESLERAFASEDASLTSMRSLASSLGERYEPPHVRALLHARCKLQSFYNDMARSQQDAGGDHEPLETVSESRPASRPISRAGSEAGFDGGSARGGGGWRDGPLSPIAASTTTDADDDIRSMTSLGSMAGGAGGALLAGGRKARKMREKGLQLVIRSYSKAVNLLRAANPPAPALLAQALHELGDFCFVEYAAVGQHARRGTESASAWQDALDQCMGSLGSALQRATNVAARFDTASGVPPAADPSHTLLAHKGFWGCVSGLVAAAKLARLTYTSDFNMRSELVLTGASLARTLFHASLAHPALDVHYAAYQAEELWGGLGGAGGGLAELFASDPLRIRVGQVLEALEYVGTELLRFQSQPVRALPVLTLYELLARTVARSPFHTANARVLKAQACLAAGLLSEASLLYIQLLEGIDLPLAPHTALPLRAHAAALPKVTPADPTRLQQQQLAAGGNSQASDKKKNVKKETGAAGAGVADATAAGDLTDADRSASIPPFNAHYPPMHSTNRAFIAFLLGEGSRAALLHANTAPLSAVYGGYLWLQLRCLRADFLCTIARARDQLSPLMDTLLADDAATGATSSSSSGGGDMTARSRAAAGLKHARGRSASGAMSPSSGDRPRSGGSANATVAGAGSASPPSLADKLAARNQWLGMAERLYVEAIALFLPRDPNAHGGKESTSAAAAGAKPSSHGSGPSAAGTPERAPSASRRRTMQNFAELVAPIPVATSVGGSAAPPTSAFEQPHSTSSLELLAAVTRNTAVLPAAVVAHAYLQLAMLKQSQGLLAEAVYFAQRSMRIMQEHVGTEVQTAAAQQQQQQQAAAGPSAPLSFDAPSSIAPRSSSISPARVPHLKGSLKDRTGKSRTDTAIHASSDVRPTAQAQVSSSGLLTVPPVPGADPPSWRQMIDARQWLRARLLLASLLVAQGRNAAAAEQLSLVDSEAGRMKDPLVAHESAVVTARMLSREGKFLQAFQKLKRVVWIEPTDADRAARAAMIAKLPGGEGSLPPAVPRANTYALDHGEALLQMLHLLRRLPAQDHADAKAARGEVHSTALLARLEQLHVDLLEQYGVRPSDLELAGEVLSSSELRARTLLAGSLPHASRAGQNLVQQRLVGVVSLYHPWASSMLHFNFLAAKHALASSPDAIHKAMQYALVAERLLALCGPGAAPAVRIEVSTLIAKLAWRRVRDAWAASDAPPDLDVGLSQTHIAQEFDAARAAAQSVPVPAAASDAAAVAGKAGAGAGAAQRPPGLNVNAAAAAADQGKSGSGVDSGRRKKETSKEREAAANAAAQAAPPQANAVDPAVSLAALTSNPLRDGQWEVASAGLPRPIRSLDPRSLPAILHRLHAVVHMGLLHGAQLARVTRACALLVEIHTSLRDVAEKEAAQAPMDAIVRPFHQPAFHASLAAFWLELGARCSEAIHYLQRHAVDQLASHALPSLSAPDALASSATSSGSAAAIAASQPFPLPLPLVTELAEAHRIRAARRKQEVSHLLAGQTDSSAPSATADGKDGAFGGMVGTSAAAAANPRSKDKGDRLAAAARPVPPTVSTGDVSDDGVFTRALLLHLLSLRAEVASRSFESEIAAAMSAEESAAVDVSEFMTRSFAPFAEKCTVQLQPIIEQYFSGTGAGTIRADDSASMLAAVRASLDDHGAGAAGALMGIWSSRAASSLAAPRTDIDARSDTLTLTLLLATELQRGAVLPSNSAGAMAAKGGAATAGAKKGNRGSLTGLPIAPVVPAAVGGSGAGGSASRKKKGLGVAEEPVERSASHALFGPDAPRFEVITVHIAKEAVAQLAASASGLRARVLARLSSLPPPPGGYTPVGTEQLSADEQASFLQLLQSLERAFGSRSPTSSLLQAGADPDPATAAVHYLREYGLAPSLPELSVLESLLGAGHGHGLAQHAQGGAFRGISNGIALMLHYCSARSVAAMQRQAEAEAATEAAAVTGADAPSGPVAAAEPSTLKSSGRGARPSSRT